MTHSLDESLSVAHLEQAADLAMEAARKVRAEAHRVREETHAIVEGIAAAPGIPETGNQQGVRPSLLHDGVATPHP
jgi:hypothetical protein